MAINNNINNNQPYNYQYNQIPNNQNIIFQPQPIYVQQPVQVLTPVFGFQYGFAQDPLVELANCVGAKIHQQIEMVEIFTGYEVPNRYHVLGQDLNGQYKYLFKCKEDSTCCQRQFCTSSQREFKMLIKHIQNQSMFSQGFENIFSIANKPYNCSCCCLCRPYMECNYSDGTNIGLVEHPFTFCNPKFYILDNNNTLKYTINCDCCQCGYLCANNFCGKLSNCLFEISDSNGVNGNIQKLPAKGLQIISDADSYDIRFPTTASPSEKLLIIFATLLIDYMFFEYSPGDTQQQGMRYRNRYYM
jgi:hypothetical protein